MFIDERLPKYPFNFSSVPKDQLGEYLRQLFKVRCKQMPRILAYIPLPQQFMFHVSPAKERMPSGGNQSGKTFSAGWDCAVFAHREYPDWYPDYNKWPSNQPVKIRLVGGNLQENIQNIMVPMINWWLEDVNPVKWHIKRGLTVGGETRDGRAVFYCISEKQGLRAHEGWTGHYVYVDEALSEEFYNANFRGTIKYKGKMVMAQTPLADVKENEWIDKRFPMDSHYGMDYEKPCRIQLVTTDNLYLEARESHNFAEQMKKSGPDQYASRVLGYSPAMLRRVIKEFNPSKHVIPVRKYKDPTTYFSIDPHPKKGEAMAWMNVLEPKPGHVPAKVIVDDHFDPDTFNTYSQLIALIQRKESASGFSPILRCCDQRFARTLDKDTGNNFMYEFRRAAAQAQCTMNLVPAKAGNIEDGNNMIRRALINTTYEWVDEEWVECPELRIQENCGVTIEAILRCSYDRLGKKVENDIYKDSIDVIRYLFTLPLGYRHVEGSSLINRLEEKPDEEDDVLMQFVPL